MQDGIANSYRLDTDEGSPQFVNDSQKHEGELGVDSTWEIQTVETKQHVQGRLGGVQKHGTFVNPPVLYIART